MAVAEYYVDPVIGNDTTGNGSSGLPWKTVQKALNTITAGADGDRINLADSGTDTLSSGLTLATYGTPTNAAPLIIQGYTSTAGDGGIGVISGGGGNFELLAATTYDNLAFLDLKLHNTGTAGVIRGDNNCTFINCEVTNGDGNGITVDQGGVVLNCYVHDVGNAGVRCASSLVYGNYFLNDGTRDMNECVEQIFTTVCSAVINNVINIDGATNGIMTGDDGVVLGNSIYSNGGTGEAIGGFVSDTTIAMVMNNVIEGFSGAGGDACELSTSRVLFYGNNIYYDCTNAPNIEDKLRSFADIAATASPFKDASSADFTLVDTNARSWQPSTFKQLGDTIYNSPGALQKAIQFLRNANMHGGLG